MMLVVTRALSAACFEWRWWTYVMATIDATAGEDNELLALIANCVVDMERATKLNK
jgi:hypothetical protein